jgi:signal transduction histidine kinase
MWLIIGLAATFSLAATVWVGSIARENVLEQHVRRLSLETDQLSSDVGQALVARLDAIRASPRILRAAKGSERNSGLKDVFDELNSVYPQLDWIAVADADGVLQAANGDSSGAAVGAENGDVGSSSWFKGGLHGPWLGVIGQSPGSAAATTAALGDMAAPVRDDTGRVMGVISAHLSWRRLPQHPERLTDESDPRGATRAYVLDRDGIMRIGPDGLRDKSWPGTPIDDKAFSASAVGGPRFERLPDGRRVLVSRAPLSAGGEAGSLGWQVVLSEPNERVYQRADTVALKILWVSICLGAATAFLGVLGARQLTWRLKRLALTVARLGHDPDAQIAAPDGVDEVAQLGQAFGKILGDLQRERRELQTLSGELERRVAVRTREVERLAEESRYAAIVRERLKIARDLHDTLAHSMMAILSEIRFLRRLQARDPPAVAEELARAEEIAHEGLKEARTAITQMRVNAVRETGLGPALSSEFERFVNRTGLSGQFSADVESGRFGDERAETLLRMAQEALRNVERHAMATRVSVKLHSIDDTQLELRIEDDGIGFDPQALRTAHYGLVGLREQAELIGAELKIDSGPNQGTRIIVRLRMAPASFVL